jgi:hypothetical protein
LKTPRQPMWLAGRFSVSSLRALRCNPERQHTTLDCFVDFVPSQ